MILEAILLGAGAVLMDQIGTDLAKNLVAELSGGAIERGMDALLEQIKPESNQDLMRTVAAALKRATDNLLVGSKIRYDLDRKICQELGRDVEKLFVQNFNKPQKAVRDALLVGTVEDVSKALESLVAPYFEKARDSQQLKYLLPLEFLHAFGEVVKDKKYEKGWKAFHRDLAWAMHQHMIALNKGQEELLATLTAMHEGQVELPDIAQEFNKQAEKMIAILHHVISEDGDKTRQTLDDLATIVKQQSNTGPKSGRFGIRILYEEHALFPDMDEPLKTGEKRDRIFRVPNRPGNIPFFGRKKDLDRLVTLLGDSQHRGTPVPPQILTGLQGLPGIGKARLALEIAHNEHISNAFTDGVLWIDLGKSMSPIEITSKLAALGRALGAYHLLGIALRRELISELSNLLRHKHMLLIVDDVWKSEHVALFKQIAPSHGALLVTSRQPGTLMLACLKVPCRGHFYCR